MKPIKHPRPTLLIRRETLRPLTDDTLASVAGGAIRYSTIMSCTCTAQTATTSCY